MDATSDTRFELRLGDCVEKMGELPTDSVDAVCTDPPYLIAFMGKDFDEQDGAHADPKRMQEWHERWAREAFRVLKPGGFLLAFGGTRTYHRLACAVEDAGFEIRDRFWTPGGAVAGELAWMYGSGFPKSLDVAKAIDKTLGKAGRYEGVKPGHEDFVDRTDRFASGGRHEAFERPWKDDPEARERHHQAYVPGTEEAARTQGWGTALKPAHEPIVVARKPLIGTVADNVLAHGTGALNVDGCRIGFRDGADKDEVQQATWHAKPNDVYGTFAKQHASEQMSGADSTPDAGRWPANVVLCHLDGCVPVGTREVASDGHYPSARPGGVEVGTVGHSGQENLAEGHTRGETVEAWECADGCPVAELDAQSGERVSGWQDTDRPIDADSIFGVGKNYTGRHFGDNGGASRFFYTAKTSRAERNAGLDVLCRCETNSAWVNEAHGAPPLADTGASPQRAIDESGTKDDSEWSTTSSGKPSTAISPRDSRFTTETRTSSTTESKTSDSSTTSPISDTTRRTTADSPEHGSDDVRSAESGRPRRPSISTSPGRDGSVTDDADHAIYESSSKVNSESAERCASCGGVVQGALRNSHPT